MKILTLMVDKVLSQQPQYAGLETTVEKELLHLDILSALQEEGLFDRLTFIGGTSLRLCYNSNRLSEDLDFTGGIDFKPSQFDGLSDHLKSFLEKKYAAPVSVSTPVDSNKDTSSWKITITKEAARKDLPSQKLHIDICAYDSYQTLSRPVLDHYGVRARISGFPIPVQSLNEILADKMVAFAYRERRIKPRDVWDIVWLKQQRANIDTRLLNLKLECRGKDLREFKSLVKRHCALVNGNPETRRDFEQEMSRFLPPQVRDNTIENPNFWAYVGTVVQETSDQMIELLDGKNPTADFKM